LIPNGGSLLLGEFSQVTWTEVPIDILWKIDLWWYSLFNLFIEFTFNELKPTTVAVFIYLQPVATVLLLVLAKTN
jgi:hypothetical protein